MGGSVLCELSTVSAALCPHLCVRWADHCPAVTRCLSHYNALPAHRCPHYCSLLQTNINEILSTVSKGLSNDSTATVNLWAYYALLNISI